MVSDFALVAAALAPAIVLLGLLSWWPKHLTHWVAPRPLLTIAVAVASGVGSAYLALGIENLLTYRPWSVANLGGLALFALIAAGLAEEGAKYLCVRLYAWRLPEFREPYDGILYGAAVGLGFGATENISYVLSSGFETAVARALTAVPFHCALGVILGYFLGQAKVRQLEGERWGRLHVVGLAWAVGAHGLYDFFAFQSGAFSIFLLGAFLLSVLFWSVRTVLKTRAVSPSWGGVVPTVQTTRFVPRPLKPRNPVLAGLLGLLPGLGHFYNGETQKGFFLMAAGLLNLLVLGFAWVLVTVPVEVVQLFLVLFGGLSLAGNPSKLVESLVDSPVLVVLVTVNVLFALFCAYDAFQTARTSQFDYLEAPDKRTRFLQSFSASYLGHLVIVFLFILAPILAGGQKKPAQSGPVGVIEFDLVSTPEKLDGFSNKPEGTAKGTAPKTQRKVEAAKPVPTPVPGPVAKKPQPAQEAKGIPHSYNEYLSWKIRRYHDLYFERVVPGEYTVVQYEIDSVGNVTNVQVLYDHTTAPEDVAELAADTVRDVNPALPLPEGVESVVITELFWDGTPIGNPGSLEYRLSQLPDGREVTPIDETSNS